MITPIVMLIPIVRLTQLGIKYRVIITMTSHSIHSIMN